MLKIALYKCPNSLGAIEKAIAEFLGNSEFTITEFDEIGLAAQAFGGASKYDVVFMNRDCMATFMQEFAGQVPDGNSAPINTLMSMLSFIADPISEEGINHVLNLMRQFHKFRAIHISVSFLTDKGMQSIDVTQILYFEFIDRKIKIKTQGSQYIVSDTLHNVLALVEKHDFYQPHKSFIVNFKHIVGIKNYNVIMSDGSLIPLSQKKSKEFRRQYKEWGLSITTP